MAGKRSYTVLVCDDDEAQAKAWSDDLEITARESASLIVDSVKRDELIRDLTRLRDRQKQARIRGRVASKDPDDTCFDDRDLVIVDFDLLNLEAPTDSGEGVSYLARCYSTCGIIVDLNQFGTNPFDTTFKGHAASFADLNLGSDQLTNPGLWKAPYSGFRPWSWPLIRQMIDRRRAQVDAVDKSLDLSVFDALGFPESVQSVLSLRALEWIGSSKRGRTMKLRDIMRSPMGLRGKDRPMSDESLARIVAARLSKWLEEVVAPGQDILVDAPHLAARFPSLVDKPNQSTLNQLTDLSERVGSLPLDHRRLKDGRFPEPDWLSRPMWFWPVVQANREIAEVADPWGIRDLDLAFAEDATRFLPKAELVEFSASDLPSVFVRRFVVSRRSDYAKRFLGRQSLDFRKVDYRPAHPLIF